MTPHEAYAALIEATSYIHNFPGGVGPAIAVYAVGKHISIEQALSIPGITEMAALDDPGDFVGRIELAVRCGAERKTATDIFGRPPPITRYHPAIVRGRVCQSCKREFVIGEFIKKRQTYRYHVDCGSAKIAEADAAEQERLANKKKEGWHGHHGRVIRKTGGLG